MRFVKAIFVLLLAAAAFVAGTFYRPAGAGKGERKVLYWVDPMHPAYKSDKPGIAPDCGMKLEPVYADGGPAEAAPADRKVLHYRDPHDHKYTSDKPGLNPETGNDLEPVYADDASAMPPGTVRISAEKQQLIGVKYGTAEVSGGARTIRAVGKVAFDETRISHVHSRTEGWVEKVYVDFTGKLVTQGQPLLTIYSPELLASQRELLIAAKAKTVMRNNPFPMAEDHSRTLFDSARRRLELWNLSEAQISRVLETGEPVRSVTLEAPASGYVTERKAFPNLKVMPDTELYTLVDLSRVWIIADVFEYEAGNIRVGQPARVTLSYAGGRSIDARVDYIQPQVDPMTRTLKVRLNAANPNLLLKPDMYADVEFRIAMPQRLTVPAEAVLDTGERKTVFVDRGNGFFEPRQVETGERDGDRITVLKGLKAGERVVTSGNFLIDSESQLKAAADGMTAAAPAEHQHD